MPDSGSAFESLIAPVLSTLKIHPTAAQIQQLAAHYDLLLRWNRRINLSGIRGPQEIVERHFGESLFLAAAIPDSAASLVDVGSGAGFPGVPVAVMRPDCQITLVESVGKKATFLREVTRDYANVKVLQSRAEELNSQFDWVTMRAVEPVTILPILLGLAPNLALLVGGETVRDLRNTSAATWQDPKSLPRSRQRYLLLGRSG